MQRGLPFLLLLTFSACAQAPSAPKLPLEVPVTQRGQVVDDFFGTQVTDPYRWLEEDSAERDTWVQAQNALAQPFLQSLPGHAEIADRVVELWDYERYSAPQVAGEWVLWTHNTGLQSQDQLYIAPLATAPVGARVLLDPNSFSEDGTVSLAGSQMSPDGTHLAFAKSDGGSDWKTWHVLEIASRIELKDMVSHTKFSSASWTPEGDGFYYNRYPADASGAPDEHGKPAVYLHRLGADSAADELIYAFEEHPERYPVAVVSHDGKWLLFVIVSGRGENAYYVKDLEDPEATVVPLLDDWDAVHNFIGSANGELFFQTDHSAPRGRVIAVDPANPAPDAWREVVPQTDEILRGVSYVGGRLVVSSLRDASSRVRAYRLDGSFDQELQLPGLCTASGFAGDPQVSKVFYRTVGYADPGAVRSWDLDSGATKSFAEIDLAFDPDVYQTEQIFVESGGVRVPMFIVSKRGMVSNTPRPTLLYGYGGFNIAQTPRFRVLTVAWLEMGGVWAVGCLRGGGEYGREWHEAGIKLQKQNVFDDFIACAEWLVDAGWTSPEQLGIYGVSNGGLLIGACLNQRPELFGAAMPDVGVLDMLRYHLQGANARMWSFDYGLSENEDEFRSQLAYSPVHTTRAGTDYPPTLVTSALGDNRVSPWHSFKYAAALQHAQGGEAPILLKVGGRAGHGAGKPTSMRIAEVADRLAFLAWALGMED